MEDRVKLVGMLLIAGVIMLVALPFADRSQSRAATPPPAPIDCANATAQVRSYRAPGQMLDLETQIPVALAAERRPVAIDGWQPAKREGRTCTVAYHAIVGNEAQRLAWTYDPQTGAVQALDSTTKRLSGW